MKIEIGCDTTEREQYCEWLNNNGHEVIIGNSTGTYIDGEINTEISNKLWDQYCGS